ncbi:MAG TPA: hypothetical protein GXX57_10875 [Firmicutes bacterium]|nr:hypothetical protein [Bacillota bacterium]
MDHLWGPTNCYVNNITRDCRRAFPGFLRAKDGIIDELNRGEQSLESDLYTLAVDSLSGEHANRSLELNFSGFVFHSVIDSCKEQAAMIKGHVLKQWMTHSL